MSELLKKSQAGLKAKTGATDTIDVIIRSISGITNPDKVKIDTDKGVFFPFKNQFAKGQIPAVGKGLKATLTLREITNEKGTIVVVEAISYNVDDLSAKQIAVTNGNALVIA